MKRRRAGIGAAAGLFLYVIFSALLASAADAPRMTGEELKSRLGNPETIIIDVRTGASWEESAEKIPGAVREDPETVRTWMSRYPPEKTLVFYCT